MTVGEDDDPVILMCDKCGQEILSGRVSITLLDEMPESRIVNPNDILFWHAPACPTKEVTHDH